MHAYGNDIPLDTRPTCPPLTGTANCAVHLVSSIALVLVPSPTLEPKCIYVINAANNRKTARGPRFE